MAKATSATAEKKAVAAPKVKKELTEIQLAEQAADKKRAKKLYTSGYWDAVRGVRTTFGEGSKNGADYDKGHVAGSTALANGKTGWVPKRAPKDIPGRTILNPTTTVADLVADAEADGVVAIDGVVADQEAQERVLAEEPEVLFHGVEASGLDLPTASVQPEAGEAVDEDSYVLVGDTGR